MPKTRKQKEEIVVKVKELTKSAVSVVFVGFDRLNVADERQLRRDLRAHEVDYTVAKKSLLKRALEGISDLPGQVALACLPASLKGGTKAEGDSGLPARLIANFVKKHQGMVTILGGIFEGKLVDASAMQAIAAMPSRQTLLGMLANVLNAPVRKLAIALSEVAKIKN